MATDNIFAGSITCAGFTNTGSQSVTGNFVASGGATITGLRTVSNSSPIIAGARALTGLDSGGVFFVTPPAGAGTPYQITLPVPTGAGQRYTFVMNTAGASNVTFVSAVGGSNSFVGTITIDAATIPCPAGGSTTLTAVAGASVIGDSLEFISLNAGVYAVRAFASGAGGITVA
jgi:hypothetical protein